MLYVNVSFRLFCLCFSSLCYLSSPCNLIVYCYEHIVCFDSAQFDALLDNFECIYCICQYAVFCINKSILNSKMTQVVGILPRGRQGPCILRIQYHPRWWHGDAKGHCNDVIMCAMASQITSLTIIFNGLFRRRSKKTWKFRVTGLCAGKSPGTGQFPAQMASNAENVSIWWRHHGKESWYQPSSPRIFRAQQQKGLTDTGLAGNLVPYSDLERCLCRINVWESRSLLTVTHKMWMDFRDVAKPCFHLFT